MYALLWCWSFTGLFLLSILANGVMGYDEMDLFNGTYVFHKQDDDDGDVLVVGLTLVQAATAEGAGKSIFPFSFRSRLRMFQIPNISFL